MDGLRDLAHTPATQTAQHTLARPIDCVGVGLHTGRHVRLALLPAEPHTGIVFRRTDIGLDIDARHDAVTSSRLCTMLQHPDHPSVRIGTIEHLMAAIFGAGIDNLVVAVDGPELPILDGSAAPFLFLIDCAGRVPQQSMRRQIEVCRTVRVEDDGAFAELRPPFAPEDGLSVAVRIDFAAAAIGRQALSLAVSERAFRRVLANARTFTLADEVEALRAAGLALGGSLDNAIVVDGDRVLNSEGLRAPDEFVRHKMLDLVGDLALAGGVLRGRVIASRPGHALNNKLLRALFANPEAYRVSTGESWAPVSVAA